MNTTNDRDAVALAGDALLRAEHAETLLPLLRVRPTTRAEAVQLLDGDAAALDTLIALRFVVERGEVLEYVAPDILVASLGGALLDEERRRLDELGEMVAQLPDLARAWQLGAAPAGQEIQGEITHGSDAAMERWFEMAQRLPPTLPCASIPDMSWIHDYVAPVLDRLELAFRAGGHEVRYLFDPSVLDDSEDRAVVERIADIGATVRLSPHLPSWFYVDQQVMVALPTTWGADSPVGMVLIYAAPIAGALQGLFDSLWATATPLRQSADGWQGVLELLAQGKSDKQVADVLGLGVRTVRRRIAEAMDDLGAHSRFELGAAWAAHRP